MRNLLDRILEYEKLKASSSNQLFLSLLFSHLLVFFIPIFVLGILLYHYFFGVLERNVKNDNTNTLRHIQSNIDIYLSGMNTIAFQISTNPRLTTYMMSDSVFNVVDGKKDISNYIIANKFIKEVLVYYKKTGRICSSQSYMTVVEYIDLFKYNSWSQESFLNLVENTTKNTVYINENNDMESLNKKDIFYIVPITSQMDSNKRVVLFNIDIKAFVDIFKNYQGNTIVIDNNRQVVAAYSYEDYLNSGKFQEMLKSNESISSLTTNFNGKDYFVSHIISKSTGWQYITLVPAELIMKDVMFTKQIFIYVLFFVIIIVTITIFFTMKINYNPIRQLKVFAENKLGYTFKNTNEIEAVRLTIDCMSKNSAELNHKINNNRTAIKEFLLANLLKGTISSMEEFNNKAADIGMGFSNHNYRAIVISFLNSGAVEKLDVSNFIEQLESKLPKGLEGYGIYNIYNNRIIFILSGSPDIEVGLKDTLQQLHGYIHDHWKMRVTIGVGNGREDIDQIGKSYIEACVAIDYQFIKGKNIVIFFDEISHSASTFNNYPVDVLKKLEYYVIEGDIEKIEGLIGSLMDVTKSSKMPLFIARCLCFDIINTIIKSMCIVSKEYVNTNQECLDIMLLTEFDTVEELGEAIKKASMSICNFIKMNKDTNIKNLRASIVTYINENFSNPTFSIKGTADSFKLSVSSLEHIFKRETSLTISEYINHLRIEKAKGLLISSDLPLDRIVTEIGYFDTSSFVRKFRQVVGTTPGNFRKYNLRSC